MSEQPSGVNITVYPSQLGSWNPMTVIFQEAETDTVLRIVKGSNLPLPTVGENVSFGNVAEVTETPEAEPETTVNMDPSDHEVVDRKSPTST